MNYLFATDSVEMARKLSLLNHHTIWIDLERNGKFERQGSNTRISEHEVESIMRIKKCVNVEVLCRINPIYQRSKDEINKVIDCGADRVMLPMFRSEKEVEIFLRIVDGRVKSNLLFETSQSLARMPVIMQIEEVNEVHLGLNDLHKSLGLDFMFELLAYGIVDYFVSNAKMYFKSYGFGGITSLGSGRLSSHLVLAEQKFLNCNTAIITRDLQNIAFDNFNAYKLELEKIEKYMNDIDVNDNNFKSIVRQNIISTVNEIRNV
jgi:hypothetical protein